MNCFTCTDSQIPMLSTITSVIRKLEANNILGTSFSEFSFLTMFLRWYELRKKPLIVTKA